MAYGDTGVGGNAAGFWAAPYPWTEGKLTGIDALGAAKTANVKFLIDTGATDSSVASDTLTGFKLTFVGVVTRTLASGPAAFNSFKGLTFQIQAKAPAVADLKYDGNFQLSTPKEADFPSLVGTDLAKASGAIFTINTKASTVAISK